MIVDRQDDLDPRPDRASQQLLDIANQGADRQRPRLQGLAPREGEQPLDQRLRACGGLHGAIDQLRRACVMRVAVRQQVERAQDRGQQIVEIVGDAAGQLAERLHLLRLAQRVFRGAQRFAAITLHRHIMRDAIGVIALKHAAPAQPAISAVGGAHSAGEAAQRLTAHQRLPRSARGIAIVGMLQPFGGAAEQSPDRPAQNRDPGRARAGPDRIAIAHHDRILRQRPHAVAFARAMIDPRLQVARMALRRFLGALGLGDILSHTDEPFGHAGGIVARLRDRSDPAKFTITAPIARFQLKALPAGLAGQRFSDDALAIVFVQDGAPIESACRVVRQAEKIHIGAVDEGAGPIGRRHPHRHRRTIGDAAKPFLALPRRFEGAPLIGDILDQGVEAAHLAVLDVRNVVDDRLPRAIAAQKSRFIGDSLAAQRALDIGFAHRVDIGRHQLFERPIDDFGQGPLEPTLIGGIGEAETSFRIDIRNQRRQRIRDRAQPLRRGRAPLGDLRTQRRILGFELFNPPIALVVRHALSLFSANAIPKPLAEHGQPRAWRRHLISLDRA